MDELLHQLGGLLLGSVPTVILFLLLVIVYRVLVYGPLLRVLGERRARTEGAVESAHRAIAVADAKAQEYEARLRAARAQIFAAREQRVQQWNGEREQALNAAREAARQRVEQARAALEAEMAAARRSIESSTDTLANEILKAVLPGELAMAESAG